MTLVIWIGFAAGVLEETNDGFMTYVLSFMVPQLASRSSLRRRPANWRNQIRHQGP